MDNTANRGLWLFLAVAVFLGLVWQYVPLENAQARVDTLPLVGTQFGGKNIPLSDYEKQFFYHVDVLKRIYDIQGELLAVTVLDGTHNRHIVHDPYYCFRGSGWEILSEKTVPIPHGTASLVKIRKGNEEKEAMFWFGNGTTNYASPMKYWMETTLRRITLGLSGPEPVLILLQPLKQNAFDWNTLPEAFPYIFKL